MNRYILIHRLTGPAILLLLGIVALLAEMHVVHFFGIFVPLLLILLGLLKLMERVALADYEDPANGSLGPGQPPYGAPYAGPYGGPPPYGTTGPASTSTSIVPTSIVPAHDNGNSDIGEGKL